MKADEGSRVAGSVHQLNVKPLVRGERGLPKTAVESARVTERGVEGDYNRWRSEEGGGDPDQAVLLLPLETIRRLAAEGWALSPGELGENITTRGLGYDSFAPGGVYRVGGAVVRIAKPCEPCASLAALPCVGRERLAEFLRAVVRRRGWYARVLREGVVSRGDAIELVEGSQSAASVSRAVSGRGR